ncbi:MAG: cytochrome-c peroxidase [Planctomycetota bacterium]
MQTCDRSSARWARALASSLCACVCALGAARPAWTQTLGVPVAPAGNPITVDKAQLGKALFWDEQLSSSRTVACGTCHVLEVGGIDPRTASAGGRATHPGPDALFGTADDVLASPGVPLADAQGAYVFDALFGLEPRVTPRRAPTVINAAFAPELFWDGRASGTFHDPVTGAVVLASGAALESLVAEPPVNVVEMGHCAWSDVVARIEAVAPLALSPSVPAPLAAWIAGRSYGELYAVAFGTPDVTAARTCMAIATYLRTLVSDQTPYDQFVGGDPNALTSIEQAGRLVFQAAHCGDCHVEPALTSQGFKYTGVRPRADARSLHGVRGRHRAWRDEGPGPAQQHAARAVLPYGRQAHARRRPRLLFGRR